ncbi:MAG: hypothetical protein NDJ94_17495 [Vicinamibacteria bacterium]|jgi:hypothetical protein|nr:hypothetical protein [Vicinamibacteria bacterium]
MAGLGGKAPTQITWIVCLVLYVVALMGAFGLVRMSANVVQWSWVIGFGLLLLAVKVRGL